MEPRIQYAQTKDGVSIAFWTLGQGMPLVVGSPVGWSHLQLEWQLFGYRSLYKGLAEKRMLVRYDIRGCGLSERDVAALSLESSGLDLEAVVDALGLKTFALMGSQHFGRAAIAYAAEHPERVSQLLLWCTYAGRLQRLPQLETAMALLDKDWEMYTETLAHAALGWEAGEQAHALATYMRESITKEKYQAIMPAAREIDVSGLLPQIKSPTLVLHRRQVTLPDVNLARELASRIPRARLVLLEGTSAVPAEGDMDAVIQAIDEFLGEEAAKAEPADAGAFRTVLFTDVGGSTALTQRLGDAKARELLREHERIVREALKAHGGSEVKTMGDGFMASFGSATKALECAIAMQRAFAEHNEIAEEAIRVRIGLNAGEPIAEDDDLFGTAVNLAARIAAEAEAGTILASDVVRQLVAGKDFLFADWGEASLKGFDEPVRLYEVRWQGED
jgi:class 3 adenylate cyclase